MDKNDALHLIKQAFEKNLKDGLLNLQVKWLIDQAETLQIIANRWIEIESNGTKEEADDFYTFVQDTLSSNS
ncbi:hypothetical protein BSK66_31620 [Paenibacillus odorifer]|uniref:Uncharacterized protein n=1 Tax=Paenibacillus odorifer TaxID=189426 RepID=A0A1R0XBA4_9BACL|nr:MULTISPECIES: hypothetical protein [Paenibacillus]ETT61241.1 hypothetical protein C171_12703 [Paenibacillus sp. FSL H8-237]OMD32209.1 hypothetical protein BJP51_16660 [Paenibacillus odorifer]OME46773.1 hypothetical protein BSK66_31620 [Paenibacillus odorifer]